MNRDQRLLVERLRGQLVRHSNNGGHHTARRPVTDDVPDLVIILDDVDVDDTPTQAPGTSSPRRGPTAVG